jgi:CBS domain-containing protein
MSATVRDVMTTGVIAVRGDTSFKEMAAMLGSSRVSGFPVIDQAGKVIGVVSETDMLIKEADRASHPELFAGLRRSRDLVKAAGVTAAELMTSPPVTIGPDEPVQHAAFLMYDRAVERLPVVDEAGHLVGIVSQVDVLSIFSRPDEEIRREVADRVIRPRFRMHPERLKATVQDGIVTLSGRPETDQAGQDIIEAARNVEGVVAVRDELDPADEDDRPHAATSR